MGLAFAHFILASCGEGSGAALQTAPRKEGRRTRMILCHSPQMCTETKVRNGTIDTIMDIILMAIRSYNLK